jgi:YHS domain-containing protein
MMKLRSFALAVALSASVGVTFAAAQDAKKTETKKPVKEVQDPVCGMNVNPADSPKSEFKGKGYYFCSLDDKQAFDKSPMTYLKMDKKDTTKK